MSRGNVETTQLREFVETQLNRLLAQLQDLEDLKDVLPHCPLSFASFKFYFKELYYV